MVAETFLWVSINFFKNTYFGQFKELLVQNLSLFSILELFILGNKINMYCKIHNFYILGIEYAKNNILFIVLTSNFEIFMCNHIWRTLTPNFQYLDYVSNISSRWCNFEFEGISRKKKNWFRLQIQQPQLHYFNYYAADMHNKLTKCQSLDILMKFGCI